MIVTHVADADPPPSTSAKENFLGNSFTVSHSPNVADVPLFITHARSRESENGHVSGAV